MGSPGLGGFGECGESFCLSGVESHHPGNAKTIFTQAPDRQAKTLFVQAMIGLFKPEKVCVSHFRVSGLVHKTCLH
jgi:hypothetical protein